MKGNIFKTLQVFRHRAIDALKNYLEQRTPRQRIRIVLIAFFCFCTHRRMDALAHFTLPI